VLRIYPLYVASVLFALLPFAISGHRIVVPHNEFELPGAGNVLLNLALLENFVAMRMSSNPVIWTLAVEVACYALAPIFVRLPTALLIVIAMISAGAFVIFPRLHLLYFDQLQYGLPLCFLLWAWLAGFIFYRYRTHKAAGALLVFACMAIFDGNGLYTYKATPFTVGLSAFLVAAATELRLPSVLRRPFQYLGDLSYPLYLFHMPAMLVGWCIGIRNLWLLALFAFAVSGCALAIESLAKQSLRSRLPRQASVVIPTAG
jgi:peptidoglycan/LPS O-acetylase OafA/YrhL